MRIEMIAYSLINYRNYRKNFTKNLWVSFYLEF